jgi:hypothetical protein
LLSSSLLLLLSCSALARLWLLSESIDVVYLDSTFYAVCSLR